MGKCSRAISLLADYMNKTSETNDFILGWNSNVQFDLSGEEPFGIAFSENGKATFENGLLSNPDVIFYSDSDLFFQVIIGKIDQDEAFSKGLIEMKGSILDSVKFRHAAELTQAKHSKLFSALRAFSKFT